MTLNPFKVNQRPFIRFKIKIEIRAVILDLTHTMVRTVERKSRHRTLLMVLNYIKFLLTCVASFLFYILGF